MDPRLDPERHIEDARASLTAHLAELGRRFRTARSRLETARAKLELPAQQIAAHPLAAVGAALAAGALLGWLGGGGHDEDESEPVKRGLAGAVGAAAVALGVRLAKELAMRGATELARGWWERRQQGSPSEVRTSYEPGLEAFLEH